MKLNDYLLIDESAHTRLEDVYARYRRLYNEPDTLHDFFALCERAPLRSVLCPTLAFDSKSEEVQRLLRGDWPEKRNIIVTVEATSIDEGQRLLERLRGAIPY
jgi:hypothetical protein